MPGTLPAPGRDAADAAAGGSSAGTGSCSTYVTSASTAVPRGALPAPYRAWKRHTGLGWGNSAAQADACDVIVTCRRAREQRLGPRGCGSATPSASLSTEGMRCPPAPRPGRFLLPQSSRDAPRSSARSFHPRCGTGRAATKPLRSISLAHPCPALQQLLGTGSSLARQHRAEEPQPTVQPRRC